MLKFLLILAHVRAEENIFKKIFEIGNQWDEGIGSTDVTLFTKKVH